MLIQRMAATFGKLQGQTLELKKGLNILAAPNETGKSTWCAFLLSMFYGINSRERDKAGFIADKNRYAPWSGSAMSGRLDCETALGNLTLLRATRRQASPMGEFQAVFAGTGDSIPELTGQNCGEALLGVSREVFERSAFIRQSGLSISQDAGLERRIAALITSGEEDTSYSEAADTLKKQLNRRRHNKTGQIPTLETELREAGQQLSQMEYLEQQLAEARAKAEALTVQKEALSDELEQVDYWESLRQRRALAEAESEAKRAEEQADELRRRMEADHIPENETIGRLRGAIVNLETVRKSVAKARTERDGAAEALLRAEAAVSESPFAGQTAEQARRSAAEPPEPANWNKLPSLLMSIAGFIAAAFVGYFLDQVLAVHSWHLAASIAVFLVLDFAVVLVADRLRCRAKHAAQDSTLQKRFGTSDQTEIAALADTYIKRCEARDVAQAEADKRSATAEALYASLSSNEQGILLEIRRFAPAAFDVSTADSLLRQCAVRRRELADAEGRAVKARMRCDLLSQQAPKIVGTGDVDDTPEPPQRPREAVTAELETVRASLAAARSSADRLEGQLRALGDPVVLRSSAQLTAEQLQTLAKEYDSLCLAMEALNRANASIQARFSPALGRRTAEIFKELTAGRYSGVVLDRTLHLSAEPVGDTIYRDSALLSAGAADQLYLAARLAICELVLPLEDPAPIILDDALANFDDARCAAALQWLKKEAERRQILLFTCHSREADFFAGDEEVFVQRLTEAV